MDKQKSLKVASIVVGIILSVLVLIVGFGLVQKYLTHASTNPSDVTVTDTTQNSATIKWTTEEASQGRIEYGTSPTSTGLTVPEVSATRDHTVSLTLLSSATTYYFNLYIGDTKYDNGGVPWQFTTKSTSVDSPTSTNPTLPIPSATPASASASPSPTSTVTREKPAVCTESDCTAIKPLIGKGCTTADYSRCLHKVTPTP